MPKNIAIAVACSVCVSALATPAQAQVRNFNIAAGDLRSALDTFIAQSGAQLIYRDADVVGLHTGGVSGEMDVDRALEVLLQGTDLSDRRGKSGEVALIKNTASLQRIAALQRFAQAAQPRDVVSDGAPLASDQAELMDIVVTAQKRSEKLQQTAASISAFSSATLATRNIQNLEGLTFSESSLHISQGEQRVTVNIRGINAGAQIGVSEQPVATHIDGFYVARPTALLGDFLDVERVEVVKGPQGTLYGRNATAGAINVITKKPTDDYELETSAQLVWITNNGGGGGIGGRLSLIANAPLGDSVRARLAVAKENRDGAFTRVDQNDREHDLGDRDDITARLQVEADLSDTLTWNLLGDIYSAHDQGAFLNAVASDQPGLPLLAVEVFGGRHNDYSRRVFSDRSTPNRPLVYGLGSTLTWQASDAISFKSLTGYRYTRLITTGDIDGTDYDLTFYRYHIVSKQWTQELQASFDYGDFKGLIGAYYFDEKNDVDQRFNLGLPGLGSTGPDLLLLLNGTGRTKAWAIFGEANYQLTDTFDITLGGRYSEERKSGQQNGLFSFAALFGTTDFDLINNARLPTVKFSAFTPRAVVRYRPSEDVTMYASFSKGFKSGGYNIGALVQNTPFDDEKLTAYEAGIKSEFLDRRVQLNVSAFFYEYKNLQVEDSVENSTITRNAAAAEVTGVEAQLRALVTDALTIDASATWLDAEFTEGALVNPLTGIRTDIVGNRLPKSARFSANFGVQYRFDMADGATLVPNVMATYQGKRYFTVFNGPIDNQDSYVWLKATLTYTSATGNWSAALFADNITNKYVLSQAFNDLNYRSLMSSVAPPRTLGFRVTRKF